MSSVQPLQTAGVRPALMEVFIKGKIDAQGRHGQVRYTRILTPAPDAYSRPQMIEVRSKGQLGSTGDEVTVTAKLGGYARKAFRSTDKETGETTMVTPVVMTLDLVE